ncbi:MAG TPA: ABC transporter ATP-binding protein [Chloroflexota bacterium]|nr:ABC transporter ATP-binding protein [Chloroflexota bacterium]
MLKLYRYLKPYRRMIAAILVLVFLQSLANLYLPTLMARIVDNGIIHKDIGYIMGIGGLMLLISAGGLICALIAAYLSAKVASGFGRIVRGQLFTRVESFSQHEFDTFGTATLITRTTNDVTQVQMVTVVIFRMMLSAPLTGIGGIIMALSLDRPLTLVLAVAVPALILAIALIAKGAVPLFRLMQLKLDRLNLVLREGLTGIRVVRAFNRVGHERLRFQDANADLTDNAVRANRIMALLMPVLMLVMNLTSVAIIWFGAIRIDHGDMQVGSLIAFTQYAMQIMFALLMVSMMFVMIPRAAAAAVRINEVLDTVADITDPADPSRADAERGFVEFAHVGFSYPGAEQPALSDVTFSARPGEVTAIIGGTGSGKSTLVNLIMRFYDVDSGAVLVDGVDVRQMSQATLRAKIGFVPQKTMLFTGSISDNLRYGKQDATEPELLHAAATAQATEFISTMSDGLEAVMAQGGANVSGGQKQRLAIARALVRRPEIYLFDDSFSALDFKTDARLRAALKRETTDATVLIIAQRVATVMDADRIIVLDEGRIAGMGTHRELMRTCEIYREIVSSQLSAEEIA